MNIESWNDKQIASVIARYRKRGLTEGGPFSLADLLMEQRRRIKTEIPPVALARKIVELARESDDGLVTYKELWIQFRPDEAWVGNKSQQIMGNALARVVEYCVRHQLPILTALVVKTGSRTLDPKAVSNICNDARDLGITVGPDEARFIDEQQSAARTVVHAQLPDDEIA